MLPPFLLVIAGISAITGIKSIIVRKFEKGIAEGTIIAEEKITIQLIYVLFKSVIRWVLYIIILFFAYGASIQFEYNREMAIAYAIATIFLIQIFNYISTTCYIVYCIDRYETINPFSIIKGIIRDEVSIEVEKELNDSIIKRILGTFVNYDKKHISRKIADNAFSHRVVYVLLIAIFWLLGFFIYIMNYENVLHNVSGIRFTGFIDPITWAVKSIF